MPALGRDKQMLILALLFIIVLIIKKGDQERNYDLFIVGHQPKAVWDLLADFRNIAKLNTRIRQWELGKEATTNEGQWQYQVTSYEAMAGDWLFGLNVNRGNVTVRTLAAPRLYRIDTVFVTESFRGLITIENESKVTLERTSAEGEWGTMYRERVRMRCPLLFSMMCIKETDFNRRDFLINLQRYFEVE